jgi:hypothetical protein
MKRRTLREVSDLVPTIRDRDSREQSFVSSDRRSRVVASSQKLELEVHLEVNEN